MCSNTKFDYNSGSERVLVNIANYFVQTGHEVTLIVRDSGAAYSLEDQVKFCVLDISNTYLKKVKQYVTWKINKTVNNMEKQQPFDLILSNYQSSSPLKIIYGSNVHYFVHNDYGADYLKLCKLSSANAQKFKRRIRSFYQNRHIIAVSENVLTSIEQTLKCQPASSAVIFNPFDFNEIREKSKEHILNIPAEAFILHVAKYGETKRFDVLLEAFSKLNNKTIKLVLLTENHPDLKNLIKIHAVQDRVLVAGFQTNPYAWMRNAQVVVLSSDSEGLPSVLIESLICGTKIVSTNFGKSVNAIFPAAMTKFIVEKANTLALSQAIDIALQEQVTINEEEILKFSTSEVLKKYLALVSLR